MTSSPWWLTDEDPLTRDSNQIVDLIHEKRLEEAEIAGKKLLQDYPEVHDGFDRLALVYEARNDRLRAAEMYQKALEFILNNDDSSEDMRDFYRDKIAMLKE